MKHALCAAALAAAFIALPARAQEQCPPAPYDRARLETLKAHDWAVPNARERNRLARALTACTASPDTALRDGLMYEAYLHWLRERELSVETMRALADDLDARLGADDANGFERPFAALILSEVVRADRIEPYLAADARQRILDHSIAYLAGVRDYRGFDESEGWRHGVAHGADLMLQLGLNPAFGRPELERIRAAVAQQLAPEGHFYIYGESGRLARAIIYMAQRGVFSEDDWTGWFAQLPTPDEASLSTQAGLARRHNMTAFLQTVWLNARLSESTADDVLLAGAEAAMRAMP
jgi:hypothetical protein